MCENNKKYYLHTAGYLCDSHTQWKESLPSLTRGHEVINIVEAPGISGESVLEACQGSVRQIRLVVGTAQPFSKCEWSLGTHRSTKGWAPDEVSWMSGNVTRRTALQKYCSM